MKALDHKGLWLVGLHSTVDRTIYDRGVIDALSRWTVSTGEIEECKWFS